MIEHGVLPAAMPALNRDAYQILKAIYHEPATGLQIFEQVAEQTDNTVVLSPAALYTTLTELITAAWIRMLDEQEVGKNLDGRKQYVATPLGQAKVDEMAAWMQRELPQLLALQGKGASRVTVAPELPPIRVYGERRPAPDIVTAEPPPPTTVPGSFATVSAGQPPYPRPISAAQQRDIRESFRHLGPERQGC